MFSEGDKSRRKCYFRVWYLWWVIFLSAHFLIVHYSHVFLSNPDRELTSRKINLGCSLKQIVETGRHNLDFTLKNLRRTYISFPYVILHDLKTINVVLQENISDEDIIKAYFHALILGVILNDSLRLVSYSSKSSFLVEAIVCF